ncbi:SDR family oxidoreductase [Ponticoccus sp. SC2-23]|uniref:SDR family NAD(P)-dependent oxidoreductase n=1 Tax=Alexandriicola marinus TaxID=2081710 RepID=UPI000FDA1F95|nr:SDR family oxidoreductase [Alexandriicola marinus]MBM1221132.1 SDR family oxidoreductase [Ponticoccus sp. SC6-9]MBM1225702.1 SDR family oxidoreductase [Ponticoccus sp. SC6-15]MBM1227854.1 SDR family oxidoreductase [Ponticoccus sp. SC6-38]MBM1234508.1 SDR family oxidoreductase [Ponticoccus sp. SC6-45]MBM1238356.1 SDR family oxidoreductase [Ponticoccus sp. SC6-49]MBM1243625.1 SDR family oxidoreductase [Ponticoccus sp. SC2-64]MBM1248032.1 SDR family oxidoreductase [Ponticoccus sp. SC6-42]MB
MSNVMDTLSLSGKVALVTGGAGLYGRQIVSALAEAGATTFIASRGIEALEAVAAEERGRGYDVRALPLDLGDQASIDALHARIADETGGCDILVNNAVTRNPEALWGGPMDAYDTALRVNASALFYLTHLFSEDMKTRGAGSIINIGSMMGTVGVEPANYAGTNMHDNPSPLYFYEKGGMQNFSRWAASILGPHGIRVNCVAPGGFFTGQPAPFVAAYSQRTQLGRMANETDLKGIIVFLASDASVYITGANIPVDGGYTAK